MVVASQSETLLPLTIGSNSPHVSKEANIGRRRKPSKRSSYSWCQVVVFGVIFCLVLSILLIRNDKIRSDETRFPENANVSHEVSSNSTKHLMPQKSWLNKVLPSRRRSDIENAKTIICSDGTTGYQNDNYCDCLDNGVDEPQTSACSSILVQYKALTCQSATKLDSGGLPLLIDIYPSRINDGIKDCLDGRDELSLPSL